jgi:hypothetical protein
MYAFGVGATYAFGMGLMIGAFLILIAMLCFKALLCRYQMKQGGRYFHLDKFSEYPRQPIGLGVKLPGTVLPPRVPRSSSL